MAESILTTHESLRIALKEYITAQYLRRIPVLLEALEGRLDQEGVLFQEPYIESSPAYESVLDGLSHASLPGWMKIFFLNCPKPGLVSMPSLFGIKSLRWNRLWQGKTCLCLQAQGLVKRNASCGRLWPSWFRKRTILRGHGKNAEYVASSCIL